MVRRARERDEETNRQTQPPPEERVVWPCFWLAEAYLPSHIPGLIRRLRERGWDREPGATRDLVTWLAESRERSQLGGWNIVRLSREGASFPNLTAPDLPLASPTVWLRFEPITAGITVVVARFYLSDEASGAVERVLRAEWESRMDPPRYELVQPDTAKRRGVITARKAIHAEAGRWLSSNLPGAFSEGLNNGVMPACDLLLTDEALPFTEQVEGSRTAWSSLLGFYRDWDAWSAPSMSLRLRLPDLVDAYTNSPMVVAGRRRDLCEGVSDPEQDEFIGGLGDSGFECFLALWCAQETVAGYTAKLSDIRDQMQRAPRRWIRATKDLEDVRERLLPLSLDIQTVASDVIQLTSSRRDFKWDVMKFWREDPRVVLAARQEQAQPSPPSLRRSLKLLFQRVRITSPKPKRFEYLTDLIRREMRRTARYLQGAERYVNEALTVRSNVVASLSNLRVQFAVAVLAVIATAIALVGLLQDRETNVTVRPATTAPTTTPSSETPRDRQRRPNSNRRDSGSRSR